MSDAFFGVLFSVWSCGIKDYKKVGGKTAMKGEKKYSVLILWPSSASEEGQRKAEHLLEQWKIPVYEKKISMRMTLFTAEGYKIGTRGFTNYILSADDMVKA